MGLGGSECSFHNLEYSLEGDVLLLPLNYHGKLIQDIVKGFLREPQVATSIGWYHIS